MNESKECNTVKHLLTLKMWPYERGGLSSGVHVNAFLFRFTSTSGLSREIGLWSGWPLKRGSTV